MSTQTLPVTGGPVRIDGAISLETTDAGVKPWRLPFEELPLYEELLVQRAALPVGVRLSLVSDSSSIEVQVAPREQPADGKTPEWMFALHVDGRPFARRSQPITDGSIRFEGLPEGEHRLEVYPDHHHQPTFRAVVIDEGATARAFEDRRPRWTVYGSSITQCGAATDPAEVWPVIVAEMFDLNLTCLGFGGNCHLDPLVVKLIRDLPADYISACIGINIQGACSLSPRSFRPNVIGFVDRVREKHADTPMVIVSPICSPPREEVENAVGLSLVKMREILEAAVQQLTERGDKHLVYADGLELFGPDLAHHMPDQLHPNAKGIHVLAEQYAKVVMPRLGLQPKRDLALAGGSSSGL